MMFCVLIIAVDSREDESFNYFVTTAYPPRVYNDVFIIRDAQNYMIKLSISHAIAQSVKVLLFQRLYLMLDLTI